MKLKANLHFHSQDDPQDFIDYSFYEGVNEAARLGFEVMALTCHHELINPPEYAAYAAQKNILLVPGVERDIEKKHVVVLNPDKGIEKINTFKELKEYKKIHPEIFILAPHPYFGSYYCLGGKLEEEIELFDAIEHSWFYSKTFNRNLKAETMAKKYDLPYLAASDTHFLRNLNKSYAFLEAEEKTIPAIFTSIRNHQFENHSEPSRFWREMIWSFMVGKIRNFVYK